jgi:hypothetical protein
LKFTLAAKVRRVTLVASEKNDVQRALKHALTFFSMTFSFGCRLTKPVLPDKRTDLAIGNENGSSALPGLDIRCHRILDETANAENTIALLTPVIEGYSSYNSPYIGHKRQ